jgi:hypothetical protein
VYSLHPSFGECPLACVVLIERRKVFEMMMMMMMNTNSKLHAHISMWNVVLG